MSPVRLSLVIPVKDDGAMLRRCLTALQGETVQPYETIVVDNGSSDDSALIARDFGATVISETTPGIPAAASAGYDAASGDVLVRLDTDTVPAVDWLQGIARAFARDEGLDAVTAPGIFTDLGPIARPIAGAVYFGMYFGLIGLLVGRVPLFGSNFALRRSTWLAVRDRVHRMDAGLHDDLDLTLHLPRSARVRFDPVLAVAVSARAVLSPSRLAAATAKSWHTVLVHAPATLPGRLLRARRGR